jgi:hypothetical protein
MDTLVSLHGKLVLIDEIDYFDLCQFNWRKIPKGYVIRSVNYRDGNGGWVRDCEYLHRRILKLTKGNRHIMVDHINGNKLDNRRCNLRICNNAENQWNSNVKVTNKSGYRGVIWSKGAWQAGITVDRKYFYIGRYLTAEDAYAAYCEVAQEIQKDFFKG